jgi:N-acetylglucosaminyl-diphospho-decaprenol L-rhamnosyltransferase
MSRIDVAIAIVTYRSAELAIGCLRSIEAERSSSSLLIRVIVVDNASKDAPLIAEAIESNGWSSWVTLVEAPRNGGFAYGNNVAFQRAFVRGTPDYLLMLNPDTLVRNGAIGALVRFLEAHPDVGIAGGTFEDLDGSDWSFAFRFPSILSELERGLQLGAATRLFRRWVVTMQMSAVPQPVDWVPGASMLVRRAVLESIGGLDENYFLYFEETDFCFRAKEAGFSTWYVPESRVMHVRGQSTKVTERNTAPKRLPAYWFESRRRYFVVSYGMRYAMAADVVALLAHGLGSLKRIAQGQRDRGIPHFLTDLANHSVLWSRNRKLATIKRFSPRCSPEPLGSGRRSGQIIATDQSLPNSSRTTS